jgi:hypothetical protein
MTVSQTTIASLQSTSDGYGILELLLIDHASFSSPVRVVNDTRDWVIGVDTFVGLPFSLKLPSQVQKEQPRATLQIDNIGRELTALVEALPVGASLTATIRVVSRATPTVTDYEFISQLSGINITPTVMSCVLGPDETMRQSAVRIRFDPVNAPALFAG